jgi:cytochrome b subunit of formate dehydrogenase
MAARYGLPPEVIESYEDSYHGWAVKRGGKAVAVCVDCHNSHAIGSLLDPTSSIHPDNVVATCKRCHPNANPKFAASYSHVLARGQRMAHDWVRLVYIWLLAIVLGGMIVHNLIIFVFDLRRHRAATRRQPAVRRLTRSEIWQHLILFLTFALLAISGFALRFPEAWWVQGLTQIGFSEELRRLVHRVAAVGLIAASLYHLAYLVLTRRGRRLAKAIWLRRSDIQDAFANLTYHLGLSRKKPRFAEFDYTQKAEYWALMWGTGLMGATGWVLWFPELATGWLPAWAVRVCEVIHFYEAILAVSAIFIWHFFFVIFKPGTYPMSWIWLDGRMPAPQWQEHHARAAAADAVDVLSPEED